MHLLRKRRRRRRCVLVFFHVIAQRKKYFEVAIFGEPFELYDLFADVRRLNLNKSTTDEIKICKFTLYRTISISPQEFRYCPLSPTVRGKICSGTWKEFFHALPPLLFLPENLLILTMCFYACIYMFTCMYIGVHVLYDY